MAPSTGNHKAYVLYSTATGVVQSVVHVRILPGAAEPEESAIRRDLLASSGSHDALAEKLEALEIDPAALRPGAAYVVDLANRSVRVVESGRTKRRFGAGNSS